MESSARIVARPFLPTKQIECTTPSRELISLSSPMNHTKYRFNERLCRKHGLMEGWREYERACQENDSRLKKNIRQRLLRQIYPELIEVNRQGSRDYRILQKGGIKERYSRRRKKYVRFLEGTLREVLSRNPQELSKKSEIRRWFSKVQ